MDGDESGNSKREKTFRSGYKIPVVVTYCLYYYTCITYYHIKYP